MRKVWVENADLDSLECNNRLVPCLSWFVNLQLSY